MPMFPITLKSAIIASVTSGGDDARSLIREDLLDEDSGLLGIMSHYCQDDRGTPMYGSLSIDVDNMGLADDCSGTVVIEFVEEVHNGCKDINKQDERQIDISFRISRDNRTLTLDVPESSRESYFQENHDDEN